MKQLIIISTLCAALSVMSADSIFTHIDKHELMNSKTLSDPSAVQKIMTNEMGFEEVVFLSSDELTLHGYWKTANFGDSTKRPTIIFGAGFDPGRKEGMAPFAHLYSDLGYNMLFFDHRGHGDSEGDSHWHPRSLYKYGTVEYQDVLGALQFVQDKGCQDIFLQGICSGAFHMTTAVEHIEMSSDLHDLRALISGIVIDSGWNQLPDIAHHAIDLGAKKNFHPLIAPTVSATLQTVYTTVYKPFHWWYNRPLDKKLQAIKHPVLCLHHKTDKLAPIVHAIRFIAKLKQHRKEKDDHGSVEMVQFDETTDFYRGTEKYTKHGNLHLVAPHKYIAQITRFIDLNSSRQDNQ